MHTYSLNLVPIQSYNTITSNVTKNAVQKVLGKVYSKNFTRYQATSCNCLSWTNQDITKEYSASA